MSLYYSFIYPYLTYCNHIWGATYKTRLKRLVMLQNKTVRMGKFDWGVRYVIIFLYVQFLIRLAAVSYRGEKVRIVVCPGVRSVNKSTDTRNCVQNGAEYTICVLFTTRLYYKALGIMLCTQISQIRRNYNRLDDDHCDVTGHRKMSALGTASAMVTTHDNSLMMWPFEGPQLFSVL